MRITLLLAAAFLPVFPALARSPPRAPAVSVEQMRRHIDVLASDAYEGRKPGTPGETKTLLYIASQMLASGLEPAAGNGSWYQEVGLVERRPFAHRAIWAIDRAPLEFDQEQIVLVGREAMVTIKNARVVFAGYGSGTIADRNLRGAVVLMLTDAPDMADLPPFEDRVRAFAEAGAAAIIGIVSDDIPWDGVKGSYQRGRNRLQIEKIAAVQGSIPLATASRLVNASDGDFDALLASARAPGFGTVRLKPRVSLDVSTFVNAYPSHNVIGRLRGRGATGESVLYLGHWDHLGICREEGPDRICNGAVDNASGIAMLIEIARNLARGPRPRRDILFMATTAEETGLLGAEYFATRPPVRLESIVAAINIDTVAIHHKGTPVAVIGRGTPPLDAAIAAAARELGRTPDTDGEADSFVRRQDGWILTKAGVPTVMVGGSFSNMTELGLFLAGPYHKPEDDLNREIVLDGAAEDTDLLIALGRRLADPARYQPPRR